MTTPATPTSPDPMPAAELGTWLFLASEAMFFAGLLVAFIVLQSASAERALFARSAAVVSRPATLLAAALLVASSVVIWRVTGVRRWTLVASLSVVFLATQAWTAGRLLSHETIATASAVYDGRVVRRGDTLLITGVRVPLPPSFDVSRTMPSDLHGSGAVDREPIDTGSVHLATNYGPSRNNYFGCYFLASGAHALHVLAGLVALGWLLAGIRRGTVTPAQTRAVALYWQFVNGVGLLALMLLSFG